MTTRGAETPPTNLKDRIAAFQQRYAPLNHPHPHNLLPVPSPTGSPIINSSPTSLGLRDKIAKFERKGGVPVPRGSFGLGAPPVVDNGLAKRRGELYGNRIPGVKPSGGAPSRSGSPLPSTGGNRSASASGFYDDSPASLDLLPPATSSPTLSAFAAASSPPPPPSPESPKVHSPTPRRSSFATALSVARRAASASDAIARYDLREASASPPFVATPLSLVFPEDEVLTPPSMQDDVTFSEMTSTAVANDISSLPPDAPETPLPHWSPVPEQRTTLSSPKTSPTLSLAENDGSDPPLDPVEDVCVQAEEADVVTIPVAATPPENDSEHGDVAPALEIKIESFGDPRKLLSPTVINESMLIAEEPKPPAPPAIAVPDTPTSAGLSPELAVGYYQYLEDDVFGKTEAPDPLSRPAPMVFLMPSAMSPPITPDGLFESSNESDPSEETKMAIETVEDTLSQEETIHSPELGTLSPVSECASDVDETVPSPASEAEQEADVEQRNLWVKLDEPPQQQDSVNPLPDNPDILSPYSISDYFASTPLSALRSATTSPNVSINVESPPFSPSSSYVVSSPPLVSHDEETAPAVFVRAPTTYTIDRPVSMIETSDFKVTSGKLASTRAGPDAASTSTSPKKPENGFVPTHTRSYSHSQTVPTSFSAVVHRKVTVTPPSSLRNKAPETSQLPRGRRTHVTEAPMSPGYGELAVLLEEAALLEKRLLLGDIPGEQDVRIRSSPDPMSKIRLSEERLKLGARSKSSTAVSPERGRPSLQRSSTSLSIHAAPLRSTSRKRRDGSPMPPLPYVSVSTSHIDEKTAEQVEEQHAPRRAYTNVPPSPPPPKSPFPRYITSLRRLASASRSTVTLPGAPRHSVSTSSEISSEDSVPIATPSDRSSEFGYNVLPGSGTGLGVGAWPSGPPKIKNRSLTRVSSRASSFAEKLWNRKRTKSTSSNDTSADSVIEEPTHRQPTPAAAPSPPAPIHTVPPLRSSSLVPGAALSPRPPSWVSLESSTSTIPSPIFDNDIFDAFPSVPQDVPPERGLSRSSLTFPDVPLPPSESQATTPTDMKFNIELLSPSNTMPLRPRLASMKKAQG